MFWRHPHSVSTHFAPVSGGVWSDFVDYWPMDDANVTGGLVKDLGTGALDLTINGGITSVAGPPSQATARAFDGIAGTQLTNIFWSFDWVTGGSPAGSFTFACWLYIIDNTALAADGNHQTIMNQAFTTGTDDIVVQIRATSPFGLSRIVTNGNRQTSNGTAIASGTWTHLGFVCIGGTQTLYAGGSAIASSLTTGGSSFGATTFVVGAASATVGMFKGRMARLRFWTRGLSSTDMSALFAAGG